MYACNPRTQEAQAIQQQPRLQNNSVSNKQKEQTPDCGVFCWVLGELYVGWSGFFKSGMSRRTRLPPKIGVMVSGQLTGSLTVGSFSQHSPILNLVPGSITVILGPEV